METSELTAESVLAAILEMGWQIALAILILGLGWLASSWACRAVVRVVQKRAKDTMLARFLGSIARWTVVAAAVIAALGKVGVEVTGLVALLASAGVAIGLALQGNLSNFASGVMLLIFRHLEIGDFVEAGGKTGKVEDIGIFATTLVTGENHTITVPNSSITGNPVTNYTKRGTRRGSVSVGVGYGSDLERVHEVLREAAAGCPKVLDDPAPSVVFTNMGASSLDFEVRFWATNDVWWDALLEVRARTYNLLNEAGIDIPYDQIVVHQADADET